MASKNVQITLDIKGNVEATTKNLRALKQQLKETAAGTDAFKKLTNDIDDLEDKLKGSKTAAGDWVDQLAAAPGPIGMIGGALNKAKLATVSFGAALKAAGIGLLVSAVAGIAGAFSQVEGAGKKLQPLMIGLEKIFGGIVEVFTPLLDAFLEMALQALPYITKGVGVFYSTLVSFFTLVKEVGTGVGKILKGIFTLDFDSLQAGYDQLAGSFDKTIKSFQEGMGRYEEGTKKMTKTEKENLAEQQKAREDALAKKLKQMETEDNLDKAKLDKMKAEALALATTEQEKLDVEKKYAQMSYDLALKDIEDKQKLYNKDSNEFKELQAAKVKLEGDYIAQKTGFVEKQKTIDEKAAEDKLQSELKALDLRKAQGTIKEDEYQKAIYDTKVKYAKDSKDLIDAQIAYENYQTEQKKKKAEEERAALFQGLQDQIDVLDRANTAREDDFAADRQRLEQRKTLVQQQRDIELAAAEGDAQKQLEIKKKYADELYNIDQTITNNAKAEQEARIALQNQYADVVGQFGNFLQSVAGKNKGLAKAGLLIEQAAGVAKIVINTQANAAKAGYLSPKGIAELAAGAIGVAAAIAATIKGIRQIDGQGGDGGGQSSGASTANLGRNYESGGMINGPRHAQGGVMINAEGGEAVMTRGAVTMFAPLLSAMNQMGGGTAFSSNLNQGLPDAPVRDNPAMAQQPMIMKTYVVSNELTTDAERQARLKDLSTL